MGALLKAGKPGCRLLCRYALNRNQRCYGLGMKYAILIYPGVEPIDLGATFGVLSMATRVEPSIEMFGVARKAGIIECAKGLRVLADYSFETCPAFDALIVTGGPGWQAASGDPETLNFLKSIHSRTAVSSICTGAMILAAAGLLDGKAATTKVEVVGAERAPLEAMSETYASIAAEKAVAVMSGGVLTSGGVSLGIDGVLYLISHLHGVGVATETARIMEYGRALKANAAALPPRGLPILPGTHADE
jgi:transcriptional regulator GlxA family with amidase domain